MNRIVPIYRPVNSEQARTRAINIFLTVTMVLGVLFLLTLASCDNNTREKQSTTDRDSANSSVAPSAHVDSAQLDDHRIEVNLTDDAIGMSTQATSGPTVFRVMNAGTKEHNFKLEGNGESYQLDANLEPGGAKELMAVLTPGTYQVYCPVDGHKDKGMSRQLTVTK